MAYYEYLWSIFAHLKDNIADRESSSSTGSPSSSFFTFLDKIAKLQADIVDFVERVRSSNRETEVRTDSILTGLYISAFCSGVEAVLEKYFDDILALESKLLRDPGLTLLSISLALQPMSTVFPTLHLVIHQIEVQEVYGCKLFDLIRKYTNSGDPFIEKAFLIIQKQCLRPFFTQVHVWVVKSDLHDPHREFFISCVDNRSDKTTSSFEASRYSSFHDTFPKETTKYTVDPDRLPDCIPYNLASQILFIGECLIISKHQKRFSQENTSRIMECCDDYYIRRTLQEVCQTESFSFQTLGTKINEICCSVDKSIRKLADGEGNARETIMLMKDTYLLGRGELFQEFLLKITSQWDSEITMRTQRALNEALEDAMYNVYLTDNTDLIGNIEFVLPMSVLNTKNTLSKYIQIASKIKWPLQNLFSSQVMDNYNKIFRFLLKLKKAQLDIQSTWLLVNKLKDMKTQILAIELRNQLLALIGNLQNYCFTDVIEREASAFMKLIDESDSYKKLQFGLFMFQMSVMTELFLSSYKKIAKSLTKIFELCLVFSNLIKKPNDLLHTKLLIFKMSLTESLQYVFTTCEKYQLRHETSNVGNLLNCLDRNFYFRNHYSVFDSSEASSSNEE